MQDVNLTIQRLQETIKAQEAAQRSTQQELENHRRQLDEYKSKEAQWQNPVYDEKQLHESSSDQPLQYYNSTTSDSTQNGGSPKSKKTTFLKRLKKTKISAKKLNPLSMGKDASEEATKHDLKTGKKKCMPFHRWILHQLGEPNFIKMHYIYILLWIFISSGFLMISGNISYIDALFMASSACTQGGMNT